MTPCVGGGRSRGFWKADLGVRLFDRLPRSQALTSQAWAAAMRKYRSYIVGSANASYPILCCVPGRPRYGMNAPGPTVPERSFERVSSTRRPALIPSNRTSRIDVLRTKQTTVLDASIGRRATVGRTAGTGEIAGVQGPPGKAWCPPKAGIADFPLEGSSGMCVEVGQFRQRSGDNSASAVSIRASSGVDPNPLMICRASLRCRTANFFLFVNLQSNPSINSQ